MDIFHEEVIIRQGGKGIIQFQFILCWAVCIMSGLTAMANLMDLFMQFNVMTLIMTVVFGGICAVTYIFRDSANVEYEYTLTNGDLDFARVIGNRRRKHDFTVVLSSVSAAGFVKNEHFARFDKQPNVKKHNFYLNGDKPHYFICFRDKDDKSHLVVYEPSEKLEELVRKFVPRESYYA